MKKTFAKAEELTGLVEEYFQTKVEMLKVEALDKSSCVIAFLIALLLIGTVVLCSMIFIGVSLSILIGVWLGNIWVGFLVTAILYLLLAVVIWVTRNRLILLPVINLMIQHLFGSHEEN